MGLFEIGKHGCHGVGGVKENKDEEGERDEEVLFLSSFSKKTFSHTQSGKDQQ